MKRFEAVFHDDHAAIVEQTAGYLAISPVDLVLHLTTIGLSQLHSHCDKAFYHLRDQVNELAALRKSGQMSATTCSECLSEIEELDGESTWAADA
jgi:hypothetical protein